MTRYSLARRTSNTTDANACLEIIASLTRSARIVSLEIGIAAATASLFGLGRPAAAGITPTSPVSLLSESGDARDVSGVTTALAWSTGPTIPVNFLRRYSFSAVAGSSIYRPFDTGLWIPAGGSLILWNLGATSAADVTITVDEDK